MQKINDKINVEVKSNELILDKYFDKNTNREGLLINEARYYPSSTKEWTSSIYSYNKANLKNILIKDKILYTLLNSYFNLKQSNNKNVSNSLFKKKNYFLSSLLKKNLKNKNFSSLLLKSNTLKNLYLLKQWNTNNISKNTSINKDRDNLLSLTKKESSNRNNEKHLLVIKQRLLKKIRIQAKKKNLFLKKTYLSIPEIKHSNLTSLITISIYNRNNQILKRKIYKLYKMFIFKKQKMITLTNFIKTSKINNYSLINLSKDNNRIITGSDNIINKVKISLYKKLYNFLSKQKSKTYISLNNLSFNYQLNDISRINLKKLKIIKRLIRKKYKKLLKYKYYFLLLSFYKFRLNNYNLIPLKNITRKIYNKKIIFRIINLKYMYLDSNIMAEAITKKLRDRKKKIVRILKKVLKNVKKVELVKILWNLNTSKKNINLNSSIANNQLTNNNAKLYSKTLITSLLTNKELINKSDNKQDKEKKGLVLFNLKNKIVTGIKVQGSGRLTKRLTASRAITKYRSKGSLKNINSSRYGFTNVMLRGYFKSNLQYVNINSYNRNGSFGVKTWISS